MGRRADLRRLRRGGDGAPGSRPRHPHLGTGAADRLPPCRLESCPSWSRPMTRLPLFQIDAFADRPFRGNPAAVMPLPAWLPDEVMQDIATENNLSDTAFF